MTGTADDACVTDRDWVEWHRAYDTPGSPLSRRLVVVQDRIREALGRAAEGRVRIVSACAGDGRDLIGALADHPRRHDVVARLVERDPRNIEVARAGAAAAALPNVEIVAADAGVTDAYAGAVPVDLVMLCGVFGNIGDDDVANTIRLLPQLCAAGATVIWTRHRGEPDLTPTIRRWFDENGLDEVGFDAPPDTFFGVGTQRFRGTPAPLRPRTRLFTFVGH